MSAENLYRRRADILNEIKEKALCYTPEWRYNQDNPDAGTVLSLIWADMLSETAAMIEEVPETALHRLLDALGAVSRPAASAEGFLSFTAQPGQTGTIVIPAETRVLSRGGSEPVLETLKDLPLTGAKVGGIYEASDEPDSVGCIGSYRGARLFEFSNENKRLWSFEHPSVFKVSEGGSIRIALDCGEDTALAATALGSGGADWELLTRDGWKPVIAARHGNDILLHCTGDPGTCGLRFHIKDGGAFGDARIMGLSFMPQNARISPDAVYSNDLPVADTGFFPFGRHPMIYDTLNISCGEALEKPGALVELSFSLRTIRLPIEGYPRPEQQWKPVMRPDEVIEIEEHEISVAAVSWEYFNGTGWNALPLQSRGDTVFRAGESPERRTIRFICPEDMSAIALGAHEGCFIRARVLSVDNAFSMYGYYLSPWMENLQFSYGYEKGLPPVLSLSFQNMDESVFTEFRSAPAIVERAFNEAAVYFEMTEAFSSGTMLWELKKNEAKTPPLVWEYRTAAGWEALEIEDCTDNFSRTGLMSYNARTGPVKTRLFGIEAFWIRAIRQRGPIGVYMQGPELTGIWENTVPARAVTPGIEANLEKNAYISPATPVNGVSAVTNPLPVTGGADAETDEVTRLRIAREFSHGRRAVSRRDIESLATEASPDIIKCRCLPNTGADGTRHERDICLVVFSRTLEFEELAKQVGEYIRSRSPLSQGKLHIVRPLFVSLSVSLRAEIADPGGALAARLEVESRLQNFIDPMRGYFDGRGWSFGELPTAAQIQNALKELKIIKRIDSLKVTYETPEGSAAADYRRLPENPLTQPENGKHEVTIICRST